MNRKLTQNGRIYLFHRILLWVMLGLIIGGFLSQWFYSKSPANVIKISEIRNVISQKESKADQKIGEIEKNLSRNALDSLRWIPFEKLPFTYLVFENGKLIFWSDNHIQPQEIRNESWQYVRLSNVHAIAKSRQVGEFNIVAYIPVKYNYPYENKELKNEFTEGFGLDKSVEIVLKKPADKNAIFNNQSEYLFTLQLPAHKIYDENWAVLSMIFFTLAFIILFYLYARFPVLFGKTSLELSDFLKISLGMGVFVFVLLRLNIPSSFFLNKIFTPYHYASNTFLATLTHLTFLTVFLYSTVHLYCYSVKRALVKDKYFVWKELILLIIPSLYYILVFNFLIGVVFNSSTELSIVRLDDFTLAAAWNHVLFLLWGVSYMLLHIKIHASLMRTTGLMSVLKIDLIIATLTSILIWFIFGRYGEDAVTAYLVFGMILYLPHLISPLMKTKWYLVIWLFVFTLFVTSVSVKMNQDKKFEKYRILAENHYINENSEEDKVAELMLEDLEKQINADTRLKQLVQYPDSVQYTNDYLNNRYLRGFWNKYEMRLFITDAGSELDNVYGQLIESAGTPIKQTHFYAIHKPQSDISFLGAFALNGLKNKPFHYFMEFYPRKYYKSYSFPNLLIETPPNIQTQLSLSIARYKYRQLVFSSGKFKYPRNGNWISKSASNYFLQNFSNYHHYIYNPNVYNYLILSEENTSKPWTFFLYFFYVFMAYVCCSFFVIWLYKVTYKNSNIYFSLTAKFLYAFVILLIVSFLSIFYISFNFIQQKYRDEQKKSLTERKNYIQSALQEKYYWHQTLDSTVVNALNFDLQDLSYTFQTDVHVFDNQGKLIASSQPAIFSKNLISTQISPLPYFSSNPNMDQNEHIGDLEYLTAYADFYNGDFLQIGYIAVPQFLSRDQIRQDIENLLSAIVHIYLVIIFIFVFLSLFIGKQLSAPLTVLESKLKEMRIGRRNEKIDYKPNDEIGHLVSQYNLMVDELERSAELLAKSERESAWKTMARQVAHEINNPLTPMKLTIQQLQRTKAMNDERFDAYFDKSTTTLVEQIENLSRIAGTFSSFARLPETKLTKVDVAKKINLVVQLFAHNHYDVEVNYEGQETGVFVMADREQLIQVFNNLLKNAMQAIPSGRAGKINVKLESSEKQVHIYFEDNGHGIPEEIRDKLFTPNFTTKSTGMGLGLAISQNIIQIAGGEITFDTELDKGTVFHILLPRIQ